jgi:glyoxylase-like metal-dependent hydrolase (beta-lactamase superfamily II)
MWRRIEANALKFVHVSTTEIPATERDFMRTFFGIFVTTLAFVGTASLLLAQTSPDPIVKVDGIRQISSRVHIIPDNSVPVVPNIGYVVGDRAVLVIDTGLGPRNGAAVHEVAKRLGGDKPLYLVTTHIHPEHDLGAQAFPDTTKLIRSTDQVSDIAESGLRLAKIFASRSAINAELLKDADFRKADITFERDYDLDLGGLRVKLTAMGPNHTLGDTIVWVEADRVLFAGDIAMSRQPAFASPRSSIRHWLASLDQLEALKPAVIVPAHGPTGDGVGLITGYRAYQTEVRDRTAAEKKAGRSLEQTVEAVTAAFGDRAPDKARLAGAIKGAYAEAP